MNRIEKLIAELCPEGVEWKKLGDVCETQRGRVISIEDLKKNIGIYPVYSSQTTNNGEIGKINTFDFDGEFVTWTTDGANAGTVFYRNEKFSITNVCGLIKIDDTKILNYKFLYYWLSIEAKKHVYYGMGNPKLMSNQVNKIPIPLPPLSIQEEIVKILDTFTALEAELELKLQAELEARRKQYEYYRNQLLTPVEHNGRWYLNGVEVEWKKLGEVCELEYGYTDIAKKEGNVRFIRITDIDENGKLRVTDPKYTELKEENKKYLLSKGDILVARTGATYGKTVLFNKDYEAVYASFLIRVKLNKTILSSYYWHFAQSNYYWKQAKKMVGGGAQPQFNANVLKNLQIPIPPLSEQERIVAILDKFDALVNDISQGLPAEIEARRKQYEYYRNRLLTFEPKQ